MALDGGGIYNGGTATLQHVTMEFNNVVYTAGAIRSFASGMLTLEDCVIRENHADHPWDGYGGGIVGNFSARNTIICGNTSPRYADYRGEYTDLGGNFIGDCAAGVSIRFVDGLARINVSGAKTYALQAATSANGPWETVKEETAPFTFTESEKAGAKFYRIVQRAD